MDNIHSDIIAYNNSWPLLFTEEAKRLRSILGDHLVQLEHIGSTSVPGLAAKAIIDIAILVKSRNEAEVFIEPLKNAGYSFDSEASSSERLFFRKYDSPQAFHLSLAFMDQGSFWERQIKFRDYLRSHEDARNTYQDLKLALISEDPSGGEAYIKGKTRFIEEVLKK